jgi:hypothetical protein
MAALQTQPCRGLALDTSLGCLPVVIDVYAVPMSAAYGGERRQLDLLDNDPDYRER